MLTHYRQTWSRKLRPAAKHLLAPLLVLCALSALSQNYPTQTRELPPVTITEERARDLMRQLTDLDAFMHSVGIENIAKDERLEAYATGFAERNHIEVFTIGYIDSDELWPRVFRNIRLKKLNNTATDQLLAAHILFIPQTEGYTVELKLEGKTTEVYELLELTKEEVELIAKETSDQQLGSTVYAKPKEARETVVSAMIAALQKVEQKTDPVAQALSPVTFQPASNQHYGFDAPVHEQLAADYPTVTIAGETLRTAWKSLKQGTPDPVLAHDDADQELTFEYNGAPLTATSTENTYTLQPVGGADGATGELIAKVGEYTAGVLQTISYAEVLTKVTIVPVNGAGSGITQSELQKRLNEIYGPAVASWQVEVMDNQTLTGWDDEGNGLDDGETGMLSNYTDEMNALIRAFKAKHKRARDTYYVFLVDRAENTSKLGYMPRKKQWGFVFTERQSTDRLITTIAHELGHGVFRLEHTFSEKGLPKGQTDNLMDYSDEDAQKLYKYQWDHVHDPASVVTLFDDEEDGAMGLYEYDHVVRVSDAWRREGIFPHDFINPTEVILQAYPVALLDTIRVDNNTLVAKINLKGAIGAEYTTYSNLEKVGNMDDKSYVVTNAYTALATPYGFDATDANASYTVGKEVIVNKSCGEYVKVKTTTTDIEGHWIALTALSEPLSEEELALVDDYKDVMSAEVAANYSGFVSDFKKDGYFTEGKEPLSWMEEQGLKDNTVMFLGMEVTKIITPFKEVLEETEKNFKADYPDAYNSLVTQLSSTKSVQGQAAIRYINNSCKCNPSNHSLGAAIDIRPALNPQITSSDKAYITFIKYLTGLDLTNSKTDQQVVTAQETFMMKIHGQKTNKYALKDIITDYKLVQAMTDEFDLLATLEDQDVEIADFQSVKADLVAVLTAYKNRVIFSSDAKAAIDAMVTYLNTITTENTIAKTSIINWDKVVTEKQAFIDMVKTAGFDGLKEFTEYFGKDKGQLDFFNVLLETGFGELPIELVKSFHKAHRTISAKYNVSAEDGEWGGSYNSKYDGMHFGLRTSFIKALTNK